MFLLPNLFFLILSLSYLSLYKGPFPALLLSLSFFDSLLQLPLHLPFSTLFNFSNRTKNMSSRRSSRISEDEMNELISKLQNLLPESRRRGSSRSSAKLLKETCNYIKSLHREVDDLSDRLSDLMAGMDDNSAQAEIIRSLLGS